MVWYARKAANWDSVSGGTTSDMWNDAADGSGSWLDNAGKLSGTSWTDAAATYDLNGFAVNLNVGGSVSPTISVAKIQTGATNAGGSLAIGNSGTPTITVAAADTGLYSNYAGAMISWGTGTCSLTVNGDVTYASTSTNGMLPYTTGQTIQINGKVTNTSSGYALVGAGSGVLTISNVGLTAVSSTGSGRAVSHGSTGNLSVSGAILVSAGNGIRITANCTALVSGNVTVSGGSGILNTSATIVLTITGDIVASGGTAVTNQSTAGTTALVGNISSSSSGVAIACSGGTMTWRGSRTLAASTDCYITLSGGTFALADGTGALALANSGTFTVYKTGGTLTTTSGANTASIVNQTATSYAAIIGGTDANKAIITGPTLPTANNVETGSGQYGYAGALQTPYFEVPAESDVKSGVTYGDGGEFEGTYAGGGGYTYGDEDPAYVLTTATGNPGSYVPVADTDVRYGVAVGQTTGTCYVPDPADVELGVNVDRRVGTFAAPAQSNVKTGIGYGAGGTEFTGTLLVGGTPTIGGHVVRRA